MDDLSTEDLRGSECAANLRRAFGAPAGGELPPSFAVLLDRLSRAVAPPDCATDDPRRLDS